MFYEYSSPRKVPVYVQPKPGPGAICAIAGVGLVVQYFYHALMLTLVFTV